MRGLLHAWLTTIKIARRYPTRSSENFLSKILMRTLKVENYGNCRRITFANNNIYEDMFILLREN
jgi:hypothetical protein